MDRVCLYASAYRDVRYIFGRPIPFDAKLAKRLNEQDKEAWAEVQKHYG
jgi:hypothetical protein